MNESIATENERRDHVTGEVVWRTQATVAALPLPIPAKVDVLSLIGCLDQLMLIGSGTLLYMLHNRTAQLPTPILAVILIGAVMFVLTAYARQLYSYKRMQTLVRQLMPFALALFQTMLGVSASLYFLQLTLPTLAEWLLLWFAVSVAGMGGARLLFWAKYAHLDQAAQFARRVVLVGAGSKAEHMVRHCAAHPQQYHVQGIFLPGREQAVYTDVPQLHTLEALTEFCRTHNVDDLIITTDLEQECEGLALLKTFESLPCTVKYCVPGNFFSRPLADMELISHMPVVTIFQTPLQGTSILLKRLEDIIIASLLLIVCAPLMLLVAALIALEGEGPILFRQKRHGFGGDEFEIFKFRSMRMETASNHTAQATRSDPRITWLGRILRRTSIDELPQLLNVLKGDMSLVGPRPHAVVHNHYYRELIDGYVARQRMKPGITGWAQINGWRGETDTLEKMRKRVEMDLYYVEHWSLWFDIKILLLTTATFLLHKNAY
jgi:putative colanic acid biosynthesis UDP-glucose lipid carrier transferase